MTITQAINMVVKEYERAKKLEYVRNPLPMRCIRSGRLRTGSRWRRLTVKNCDNCGNQGTWECKFCVKVFNCGLMVDIPCRWVPQVKPKRINDKEETGMKELKDAVALMNSKDYKERFRAEYYQTKIRYEKLKAFNTKIEAAHRTMCCDHAVTEPKYDCPADLLVDQQAVMGQYLHLLEVRAVIEGIEL